MQASVEQLSRLSSVAKQPQWRQGFYKTLSQHLPVDFVLILMQARSLPILA